MSANVTPTSILKKKPRLDNSFDSSHEIKDLHELIQHPKKYKYTLEDLQRMKGTLERVE
jgi:hypothetical protein